MLRSVKTSQRLPRQLAFKVDGTGTASIVIGSKDATLTDNGTGRYTLTFAKPFARDVVAVGSVIYGASGLILSVVSASKTAVQVRIYDGAGADQDADFHLIVMGFDAADEY